MIKLKKRTWAKLITLNTIHWYYDSPEPTKLPIATTTKHADVSPSFFISFFYFLKFTLPFSLVFLDVEIEECKRRAFIKQQGTTKNKQEGNLPPKASTQANPSLKKRLSEKTDRPPKKPKVEK